MTPVEMESLPTDLSEPSRQMLGNQQSDPDEETEVDAARRPESGGVVVALPALLTVCQSHALIDLQGGALKQNLMAETIEEETGTGRDEDIAPWTIACCQMERNREQEESIQHYTREGGVSHEDGAASATGDVHVKLRSSCRIPPCKGAVVQVQVPGIEGTALLEPQPLKMN